MTISSLSSPDYYSTITNSSKTHKSSTSNPLNNALTAVEGDLESGDTTDASTVLTNLLANAPGSSTASSNSTASSGSSSVGDQITSYLKSLQSALSSGDTSTAKNILTQLNNYLTANAPTGAGMYSSDGTVTSASSSSANALNTIV